MLYECEKKTSLEDEKENWCIHLMKYIERKKMHVVYKNGWTTPYNYYIRIWLDAS